MGMVAGIDIGNASTEVALAERQGDKLIFLATAIIPTTGIKGTRDNLSGVFQALTSALDQAGRRLDELELVRINEAAPVIGDVAMETITETVITESTMIGHNPSTPGGLGIGVGTTIRLDDLAKTVGGGPYLVVVDRSHSFDEVARVLNEVAGRVQVTGAIMQRDDGVLVHNRLDNKIPIVDEVTKIEKVPLGMLAAIEVAEMGRIVETLSNPFGIATLFGLDAGDTMQVVPLARSLVGNRSAVVIRTPKGDVKERRIPAGTLTFHGRAATHEVDVDRGAEEIMAASAKARQIHDITGAPGTNVGGMMENVRVTMSRLTNKPPQDIHITDMLAVDTQVPRQVAGGIADEFSMEAAVGIAVMVKADRLQMETIAADMASEIGIPVEVGGVEADMAIRGALTTPGTAPPVAILDMGAGSTDASVMRTDGSGVSTHLAGAGNMVTLMIQSELGLETFDAAEDVKRYPLAKVEASSTSGMRTAPSSSSASPCRRTSTHASSSSNPKAWSRSASICRSRPSGRCASAPRSGSSSPTPCVRCARSAPPRTFVTSTSWCWSADRRSTSRSRNWSPRRSPTTAWWPDARTSAAPKGHATRWPPVWR